MNLRLTRRFAPYTSLFAADRRGDPDQDRMRRGPQVHPRQLRGRLGSQQDLRLQGERLARLQVEGFQVAEAAVPHQGDRRRPRHPTQDRKGRLHRP